jgi:hypothetical protein
VRPSGRGESLNQFVEAILSRAARGRPAPSRGTAPEGGKASTPGKKKGAVIIREADEGSGTFAGQRRRPGKAPSKPSDQEGAPVRASGRLAETKKAGTEEECEPPWCG